MDYKDEAVRYRCPYLEAYWLEKERRLYLIMVHEAVAGFALVRCGDGVWKTAECYVKPALRHRGVGGTVASDL